MSGQGELRRIINLGSGDALIDDCHMFEPPISNQRKRQPSEPCPLQGNETLQPSSKRQQLSHLGGSNSQAAFWDNLSKIWLTKRALRELDRRNTQRASSPPSSSYPRAHRPIARRARAELKTSRQPTQPAADFLCLCGSRCLKNIKQFARRGGPDLSDLRGVRIAEYLRVPDLTILSLVPRTYQSSQSHNEPEPA